MAEIRTLPPLPDPCRVSVVIPCRNEEEHIERCITSLAQGSYPSELITILVCDGESTDGTAAIVQRLANTFTNVRLLHNTHRTTPHALNLGIQAIEHDVAIIFGAHAEADPDFVRANVEALRKDNSVGCAGGVIENVYTNEMARRIGAAMGHPFGVGSAHFRTGLKDGYVDTVAFGCYRKEVFGTIGYFDAELVRNQDDEFNYRVECAGFRILLDRAIRSRYFVRASYGHLFDQYEQYGFWKVLVNRKHGAVTTLRQVVPALWVAWVVMGSALAGFFPAIVPVLLAGMFGYAAVAGWSAWRASSSRTDVLGVLQAFVVLHAGYGTGYLRGIWELLVRRKDPKELDHKLTRGTDQGEVGVGGLIANHGALGAFALLAVPWVMNLWPLAVPGAVVLTVLSIGVHHWEKGMRKAPGITSVLAWCGVFYLVHLLGIAWTKDLGFGGFDLEVKSMLQLIPLLFWFIPSDKRKGGALLLRTFVRSAVLVTAGYIMSALVRFALSSVDPQGPPLPTSSLEFFSAHFVLLMHPSYFALYATFAVLAMSWVRGFAMSSRAILLIGVIFSASKLGWVVLLVLLPLTLLRMGSPHERRRMFLVGTAAIGLFAVFTMVSPFMREKIDQVRILSSSETPAPDATGSSALRRLVWSAGGEVCQAHWPWGTGTGDVKHELLKKYEERGYVHPLEQRLNAHGQFLQTATALGLLGLVTLCCLVLIPMINGLRKRDGLLVAFLALCAINWSVESMLEVQAGVVFLAFGAFMLALRPGQNN